MNITKYAAVNGALTYDDAELHDRISELCNKMVGLRNALDRKLCRNDKYDYLSLTIARLAYEFAREEHNALCREAAARGIY